MGVKENIARLIITKEQLVMKANEIFKKENIMLITNKYRL
jgi:hypothetical protein